jgi:hypothetical protein
MAPNLVTARRNGCVFSGGRAATSSSKEFYLVAQDNVIKMARQVKVCDPPARGSGIPRPLSLVPAGLLSGQGHSP